MTTRTIAVLYATRKGQTAKIATRVAEDLRAHGCEVVLHDVRETEISIAGASAVVLAASVHLRKHEKEMVRFVRAHHAALAQVPTLFLSVSMSEASAEMPGRPAELRAKAVEEVRGAMEKFFTDTGFRPTQALPVAGALAYTQYSWLTRYIMKRISATEGGSTDTSRDHEYTDWVALDAAVDHFAEDVER